MAIHADIVNDAAIFGTIYRYMGLESQHFLIALIIVGIDSSTTAIVSVPTSQPIKSMALSAGDDDTIDAMYRWLNPSVSFRLGPMSSRGMRKKDSMLSAWIKKCSPKRSSEFRVAI
jgi:hypothetical protein